MDSLNSWLPAQLFTLAGLLLVVGVALMFVWRAISRPQVKGPARNGRQSRLGVVDSYGVGSRQLVLVRRDNVEHLIMIGGPNDLLVESSILRARSAGQAPRSVSPGATPMPLPERAATVAAAPRQVEEDFVRPAPVELPPVAKVEPPAPVPAAPSIPLAPAFAAATPPAASAAPATRPSVIPPREPGFFQRATSRFPNFSRPATPGPAQAAPDATPAREEPSVSIDTAHFEEMLAESGPAKTPAPTPVPAPTPTPAPKQTAPAAEATTTAKPKADLDFEVAEGLDLEPAPEAQEDLPPPPTTPRLTLPEIRLPDLKLPEWRRPDPTPAPAPTASRPAPEIRVEPRFTADPRPAPEPARIIPGGRIEPSLGTPAPRVQAEPTTRPEPFRIGERLTTPTRPATPPPAAATTAAPPAATTTLAATTTPPATTTPAATTTPKPAPPPPPAEPEDPFASLEEEMASLLGRSKDDGKKS